MKIFSNLASISPTFKQTASAIWRKESTLHLPYLFFLFFFWNFELQELSALLLWVTEFKNKNFTSTYTSFQHFSSIYKSLFSTGSLLDGEGRFKKLRDKTFFKLQKFQLSRLYCTYKCIGNGQGLEWHTFDRWHGIIGRYLKILKPRFKILKKLKIDLTNYGIKNWYIKYYLYKINKCDVHLINEYSNWKHKIGLE